MSWRRPFSDDAPAAPGWGRTMAAIGGVVTLIGCVLPWWQLEQPGGGLPLLSGNGLDASGIRAARRRPTLLLVALPYAVGDRLTPIDVGGFAALAVIGWIGLGWRVFELFSLGAFRFSEPGGGRTTAYCGSPTGLVILSRAAFVMTRSRTTADRSRPRQLAPAVAGAFVAGWRHEVQLIAGGLDEYWSWSRRPPAPSRPASNRATACAPARLSAAVGSSRMSRSGPGRGLRSATRRRSPADSPSGARSRCSPRPTASRAAPARGRARHRRRGWPARVRRSLVR